jgi:hypothetical protein
MRIFQIAASHHLFSYHKFSSVPSPRPLCLLVKNGYCFFYIIFSPNHQWKIKIYKSDFSQYFTKLF